MKNLTSLSFGHKGIIRDVSGGPELSRRLLEMGLTRGTQVELIRRAPFRGPLEVSLRGYRLTLRDEEARLVLLDEA